MSEREGLERGSGEGNGTPENNQGKECFYCHKTFKSLGHHVANVHKNAIRCEIRKCQTYFNTEEEKEQHNEEVHQISRDPKKVSCLYCKKEYLGISCYRDHVKEYHINLPIGCTERGCLSYFKNKEELECHLESAHKEDLEKKIHECKHCLFRTARKDHLKRHIERNHYSLNERLFQCVDCKKMFASQSILNTHKKLVHSSRKCTCCQQNVPRIDKHLRKKKCIRCKDLFDCSGLLEKHQKGCKQTDFQCDKCGNYFSMIHKLNRHKKTSKKCGETPSTSSA